ncbi:hypothetical protein [Caudoviricetes sp.]|nr:hypothetical protein [Caudoviricetes sp.]
MATVKNNNRPDRGKNRKAGNAPELTAEEKRTALAKQLGIKPKTKEFIDLMNDNPKLSATEAYIRTHETESRVTAGTAAHKLLKKPSVIGYKDAAVKKAKRRIVTLVDSSNESIALKASQDIIDRNEGKSVQKTENLSRTVEVKLDLTGVRLGAHYIPDSV